MTKTVFTLYGQIGLWDQEDNSSYPQFITGKEKFLFGTKGAVIAVPSDKDILVSAILNEKLDGNVIKICEDPLIIGNKGLDFGNIPAATIYHLDVQPGHYLVEVFSNSKNREKIDKVEF